MKGIIDKILVWTSLAALCIVLPFAYLRQQEDLLRVSGQIQALEREIRSAENKDYSAAEAFPLDLFDRVHRIRPPTSERILGGTCFYELHEIEGFLMRKLEGMDKELAFVLASKGIVTREDLAEQAVDDLEDIEDLDPERAAQLIMTARAHWFETEQQA